MASGGMIVSQTSAHSERQVGVQWYPGLVKKSADETKGEKCEIEYAAENFTVEV